MFYPKKFLSAAVRNLLSFVEFVLKLQVRILLA